MAEYKIIFKADQETEGDNALTWEPGCPALVTAIQVSRNTETSATYLQVKVRNVSDAAISSIFAGLEVSLPDGSADRVPLEYLDVDIPAGAETALKPISLSHGDISSCALAISRIDQVSGKWQTSAPAQPLPEKKTLPYLSSRAIDQRARALNAEVTDDILRGAVQDHGDWWVCACGQVNAKRDTCCNCNQKKTLLQANEGETQLLADADKHDERLFNEAKKLQAKGTISSLTKAVEQFNSLGGFKNSTTEAETCQLALTQLTATRNSKVRKTCVLALVIIAIVSIAGFIISRAVIPNVHHNQAMSLAESGKYDEAIKLIEDRNEANAESNIIKLLKEKALSEINSGDLSSACETASQLKARSDEGARSAEEIASQLAECCYDNALYKEAAEWYQAIGDSEGCHRAMYQYAKENFQYDNRTTYEYLKILSGLNYQDSKSLYDNLYSWKFEFKTCSGKKEPSTSSKDSATFPYDPTGMTKAYLIVKATNHPLDGGESFYIKCTKIYRDDSYSKSLGDDSYDISSKEPHVILASDESEVYDICRNTADAKELLLTVLDADTNEVIFERTLTCEG